MKSNIVKCLLIVDLQKEFGLSENTDKNRYYNILNFVTNTKDYDIKIATICKNKIDSNFVKSNIWLDCINGVEDLEFKCDRIIEKFGYGLDKYDCLPLEYEYDIIGYNTDACVLKVALDMFDRGYNIRVVSKYCYSSNGENNHQRGLHILKDLIGDFMI